MCLCVRICECVLALARVYERAKHTGTQNRRRQTYTKNRRTDGVSFNQVDSCAGVQTDNEADTQRSICNYSQKPSANAPKSPLLNAGNFVGGEVTAEAKSRIE